jgi:hypothetical protein
MELIREKMALRETVWVREACSQHKGIKEQRNKAVQAGEAAFRRLKPFVPFFLYPFVLKPVHRFAPLKSP